MSNKRTARPSASKRAPGPALPKAAASALDGLFSMFTGDDEVVDDDERFPANEAASSRRGTGVEVPIPAYDRPATHLLRSFLFADVSGFTAYVDQNGEHAAIEVLDEFRQVVRAVAARRGVRVGKWLGDGVMLVGTSPAITVSAGAELFCHYDQSGVDIHAGLASGPVLLFEGDDYIGRPVNLAARLCDAAGKSELLASIESDQLPEWIEVAGTVTVRASGMGDVANISQLVVARDVLDQFNSAA